MIIFHKMERWQAVDKMLVMFCEFFAGYKPHLDYYTYQLSLVAAK